MSLKIGDKAPTFSLSATDGAHVELEALAGAPALAVIFSCNHCPYVMAWEDRMEQINRDYADRGFKMVAINANDDLMYPEDSFEAMVKRASERGFTFPYLRDDSQDVPRAYGAQRTPEVFLFDKDLRLAYHGAIDDNYEEPSEVKHHYLRDAIEALLAGRKPDVEETEPVGCTIKWR